MKGHIINWILFLEVNGSYYLFCVINVVVIVIDIVYNRYDDICKCDNILLIWQIIKIFTILYNNVVNSIYYENYIF